MDYINKFDWSKWGFWLALGLFIITGGLWFYQTFVFEKKPQLNFEIISNQEVITLNEDINKLELIYDGIDLRKNSKTLSLITFKVINDGESGILKSFYDNEVPVGFFIANGKLLNKPEIIGSNDKDYFKNYLKEIKGDSIIFNDLIFDSKKFFELKCLSINTIGVKPKIITFGKIANVDKITVKEYSKDVMSWWNLILAVVFGSLFGWFVPDLVMIIARKIKGTAHNTALL